MSIGIGLIVGLIMGLIVLTVAKFTNARPSLTGGERVENALGEVKHANLSWPSRSLTSSFEALPENFRPSIDIVEVVTALDVKYGADDVTSHFMYSDSSYSNPRYRSYSSYLDDDYTAPRSSWTCPCVAGYWDPDENWVDTSDAECEYHEYHVLNDEIMAVKQAIAEQERALELAGVQTGLDNFQTLAEALRSERQVLTETTEGLRF